MFVQKLNSAIGKHEMMFIDNMTKLFKDDDIKSRLIKKFNKSDLEFKLKDTGEFATSLGLDNYKTGDYINISFYQGSVMITLQPVYNLETDSIWSFNYKLLAGVTERDCKQYTNNDYKKYLVTEGEKHEPGLLKVKDSKDFDQLAKVYYDAIEHVLHDRDK